MSKNSDKYELPDGWIWTTIGELGVVVSGGTPSTEEPEFWNGDIPWVTPADLSNYNSKYISNGRRFISEHGLTYSSAVLLPKGSLLFSSRAPIGYVAISQNNLTTNQGFKNLIPVKSLCIEYLYYYLKSAKQEAIKRASGTTFLELSANGFSQIPIPLPPLEEQYNIVSKIEELFSELEQAENVLRNVKKQISILKVSILKNSFNGNMTQGWRNRNSGKSAKTYISKIKAYREQLFIQQNSQWKIHLSDNKKQIDEANAPLEMDYSLTSIPKQWAWVPLGDISNVVRGASPRPAGDPRYFGGSTPWITVAELTKDENMHLTSASSNLTELGKKESRYIKKGSLLLTNSGATLGVPKISLLDGCINDGIVAILNLIDDDIKQYLYWFLKSKTIELRKSSQGAGQPNLNTFIIKNILIPLPSYEEQLEILQELEQKFIIVKRLNNTVDDTLVQINALKQIIYNKAFTGKLQKQIDEVEPANLLLEKIKYEKQLYLREQKAISKDKPKRKKIMENKKTILEVLKSYGKPMSAKDVWLQSKYRDDIEAFYSELRDVQNKVIEIKRETESLLSLRHED
jgi:type I restriction enzyme S subunit